MLKIRLAAAGAAAAALAAVLWINAAPGTSRDGTVSVPPGTVSAQVVRALSEQGQVRSVRWLRFLLRATGADRRLRAGLYPVEKGDSAFRIARRLASGRGVGIKVTVPEGWTADRVAGRLEAAGVCGAKEFLDAVSADAAEGFLFPETYSFDPYLPAARARDLMTDRFAAVWREVLAEDPARAVELSTASPRSDRVKVGGAWWTVLDVVTLASIVEREGGRPEERSLIAAVYHNRLRKRMRLEADPTVQYALGRWKERLLKRDLAVNSPYNTYKRFGLPPGPIGSPGREALRAALAPADAPYLYFVADEQGGHFFSVSYGEHQRNVAEYHRRRRAARR